MRLTPRMSLLVMALPLTIASASGLPSKPAGAIPPTPPVGTCIASPPNDYVQTIHAPVEGDDLTIRVSGRVAGSVDSLTWRGKEFINDIDHGREISYAWHFDGYGECENPTEPGTLDDYTGPTSSSVFVKACQNAENSLSTTTQPAYWLAPGEKGTCDDGSDTAVNETVLSGQMLERKIDIGFEGLDNVIVFTAKITLDEAHEFWNLEIPTGYLTYEFTNYWRLNPVTGEVSRPESEPLVGPWSFVSTGTLPPILSTPDGQYAMGAYTDEPIYDYTILATNDANLQERTNKWAMVLAKQPAEPAVYTFQSFVIVGTLDTVKESMAKLYALRPTDFNPPSGYIDSFSCQSIEGWAWDPKAPDQPLQIEIYLVDPSGEETLVSHANADVYRTDLASALGDNGKHGFSIRTHSVVPDNREAVLRVYALNSNPSLPKRLVNGSGFSISCPEFGPPATRTPSVQAPTAGPTTPELDKVETATSEPSSSASRLPCLAGAIPLGAALLLTGRRRMLQKHD